MDIRREIENTRDELNILIKNKEIITNDKELLELSIKLDKLINEYMVIIERI
ncbi:aspartyl-phosphate phosphatase Spo0E family protein [Clostridium beijerinckii]|uniref:aspartyl-phosphate phosphatase Spo0E family protein n=1 Tax=Clostridium beijerinckii TaxID=1520 RepID=UPI0009B83022|nr:aspartyl-phosphate phosphatase Spo0E family protein [Clostridium beijerinckii]